MNKTIVWFRLDLRLSDNPAFNRALERGGAVMAVYILEKDSDSRWKMGGASRWWLHHALADLGDQIKTLGGELLLLQGDAETVLDELVEKTGADAVYWNRRYDAEGMSIDSGIKSKFKDKGFDAESFNASLIFEPWTISSKTGNPYKVYTPFRKALAERDIPSPETLKSDRIEWADTSKVSVKHYELDELELSSKIGWDKRLYEYWNPTREGALERLGKFLIEGVNDYKERRNIPSEDGTSGLSPYLHFGQIGPREVYDQLKSHLKSEGAKVYHQEILWREFAYNVLYHFPNTPTQPLQAKYRDFPWQNDPEVLKAWKQGRTGYPIVDAGLRQMWATGWMHNRVRMIVGSFLVKHLLHSWLDGAEWFWDCLVDADLASNTLGWQWAGGCGADAAPYFRIFNPIIQGQKFDPDGTYVKRWVPELKNVPRAFIHEPWEISESELKLYGIELGENYPKPIIEHRKGRERALKALESIK